MRLEITGRHVEVTAPLRQLIDRRLSRLGRVLNDAALSAQVTLTREKYRHLTEIVIHARGDHLMRGTGEGNAWPVSMRQAAEKIEQQAHKLKGKWNGRKRGAAGHKAVPPPAAAAGGAQPAGARRIIRATRYAVKPMSVEDAALHVESGPETFLVFRNSDTDAVTIVYRRRDGHFGLIEPE
jgi:putative sigma-54 modulation protein